MAKQQVPYAEYRRTIEEAEAVSSLVKTDGWKVLERDMLQETAKIQELLVQNKLRTVHETITTRDGTKTLITTADTQIAENAGMFKMVKWILDDIEMKVTAPDRLQKLEKEGLITVEKAATNEKEVTIREILFMDVPAALQAIRDKIQKAIQ
jgi:hypothetical protein